MTDADYLRALFPDRYCVAGVWLKHYCIGHVLLLEKINSPFVNSGTEPKLGDLRIALAICKRDYTSAVSWLQRSSSRWGMPIRFCTPQRFVKGVAQFADYVNKSFTHPVCWQGASGRKMGMPFFQSVKLTLLMLGKTETEALSCPLSLALWDYTGYWELRDRMQIVGSEDREAMKMAKMLAERRN